MRWSRVRAPPGSPRFLIVLNTSELDLGAIAQCSKMGFAFPVAKLGHVDGNPPKKMHPAIVKCVLKLKSENPTSHSEIEAALDRLMADPNADTSDVITTLDREFGAKPIRKSPPKKRGRETGGRRSRR
jgi:hypothetical protein